MSISADPNRLLRLPDVLHLVPVSRSAWWKGVKEGKFPQPIKLAERTTCWRYIDIVDFIKKFSDAEGES